MSASAELGKAAEKKEESAAAAASPSSINPVHVTETTPEVPDNVNLSVKPEVADSVVVAVATVDSVQQDKVELTAVPTSNQPTAQTQPTAPNQPVEQNQPTVQTQPPVQNQPSVPSQPTIPSQQTVQTQPTVQTHPTATPAMQGVGGGSGGTQGTGFKSQPDDFYRTIFYFSGMGRVIGSALAEGVYVDEKNRRSAIDPDEVLLYTTKGASSTGSKSIIAGPPGELITSARNQAVNLSADFRRLQTLLESVPTFTDADQGRSAVRAIDDPIHGELYFRSERPEQYEQQQQQQRMRQQQQQVYIMDQPSIPSYQNMNGHLINVPWNYQSNY